MPMTPLPTPPSRNDPTNFAARADAFLGALPTFQTEANALEVAVDADAVAAAASAALSATRAQEAASSAAGAAAAANVTKWVSGTTYIEGVVVWSPITYLSYRRRTTGGGTIDPSADSTNWAQAAGTGDVTQDGTQTLTNKTLTTPTITGGTVDGSAIGFRGIPSAGAAKTSSYTLATTDRGDFVEVGSGGSITVPTSTFAAGDAVVIFNNTTGNITLTTSAPTTYVGGTNTARTSVTLATRGICNVLFVTPTLAVITGNVT